MSDNESPQAASDGEGATRHTGGQSIFQLATNLAAAGAVLLTGFALTKAYAVADFSLTTGAALLTAAPVAVLLGSLMSYAYWVFPLVSAATSWAGFRIWKAEGWSGQAITLLGVAVFTALLSPARPLLTIALALTGFVLVFRLPALAADRRAERRLPRRTWLRPLAWIAHRKLFSIQLFFLVAAFWVLLTSLTEPWIPIEIITFHDNGGQHLILGNVLAADDTWTTILRAGDRGLSRIKSDDVLTRQLCHLTGSQPPGQAPLLWTIAGRSYNSPNHSCARLVKEESAVPVISGSFPK
jgi:hypothetical protein